MQLNMGGLRLNTLFSTTFSIIFFFTSFSFSSISLPSTVYISSFSILSFSIFSFNVRWSFLACLGVINFKFISCPSCLKQRERPSRLSVLKWSDAHLKRRWQEFVGAISHNTSFTHCPIPNLILSWFRLKLVGNWSFPPIFGLQHCWRCGKRMQLNMGGLRLKTCFSTSFSIIFIFTSFCFSSISLPSAIYISSFSILSFSFFSFNVCWWRIILFLFKIIEYGVSWLRKLSEIPTGH